LINDAKNTVSEAVEGTVGENAFSLGYLVLLFTYLVELSHRICRRGTVCEEGEADYIETAGGIYTKLVRIFIILLGAGCGNKKSFAL